MNMSEDETPRIIVDSDWKSEAQAEKARLAEAEAAATVGDPEGSLPPADFRSLVGMLATQAVMYLGGMAHPETGAPIVDLEGSRHFIELLAVLEEKTKGNTTEEESADISGALRELRARWVEISRAVAAQLAKQGGKGAGSGSAGPMKS